MITALSSFGLLLARLLISAIFIIAAFDKIFSYNQTLSYITSKEMQNPILMYFGAVIVELVLGVFILVGFWTRTSALLLFIFMIPTTYIFHDFWNAPHDLFKIQFAMFLKNLAICGGLIALTVVGAGNISVDSSKNQKNELESTPNP